MKLTRRRRIYWALFVDDPRKWRIVRWLPWLIPLGAAVATVGMWWWYARP